MADKGGMTVMKTSMLKIYGERNVGTNHLHSLISKNLDIDLYPGLSQNPFGFFRTFCLEKNS